MYHSRINQERPQRQDLGKQEARLDEEKTSLLLLEEDWGR
jgi:hypothetical protein